MIGNSLVREARRRAGLSQAELARRAGTTQSSIARLEVGDVNPSFELVRRLVRECGFALNVSLQPYDDSDLIQAQRLAELSPQERLADLVAAVDALTRLRAKTHIAP
ncbi:MAG TPA: helix-turn-helix domain-containing protein [Chloroflexota bacterium]|nr:helix-turn-helix domain-containing protein [Chloroflexota bacterium]